MRENLWFACLLFLSFFLNGFSAASGQERSLTAREVVQRIQDHVGVPWQKETVDTFKVCDPDIKVTGIAVTMMATFDVLQRAAASGANLIITHEPTFYNHLDDFNEIHKKRTTLCSPKNWLSSRNTIWSSGDFTITGTSARQTASKQE